MRDPELYAERSLTIPFRAWMIPLHGYARPSKEILAREPFDGSARTVVRIVSSHHMHAILESPFIQFCDSVNRSFYFGSLKIVITSEIQVGTKIRHEIKDDATDIDSETFDTFHMRTLPQNIPGFVLCAADGTRTRDLSRDRRSL